MDLSTVELLAPAGNLERLQTAVQFGANAVYCSGQRLSLRAFADNFSIDELHYACDYCHQRGKKVYVALNAYMHEDSFYDLKKYTKQIEMAGADALIVSDPGALLLIRETLPDMEIHLSTQANTLNSYAIRFWDQVGVKRIVLARECNLTEIRKIRENISPEVELEAFVHGAMCVAYSGRCLLSSLLNSRDGNGGACSQPCRRNFELRERDVQGNLYPIQEDDNGTYILNSCDMNMIEHLELLAQAGINSFKIEGRMKTSFYVATIINAYRMAMDSLIKGKRADNSIIEETYKIRHRPYSTGFYFSDKEYDTKHETQLENANPQTHEFVGLVLEYDDAQNKVLIEQRNRFFLGDSLEVLSPHCIDKKIEINALFDEEGNPLDCARHPQQKIWIPCETYLKTGDILRKKLEIPWS